MGMQQGQHVSNPSSNKPPLNAAKEALRSNDTAGSDSDSDFLTESWRGCEEKHHL